MEAVTHKARVYLNGVLMCEHKGGFLPFEAEISDALKAGENLLTIAVDNRIGPDNPARRWRLSVWHLGTGKESEAELSAL